ASSDPLYAEWGEQVMHEEGGEGRILISGLPAVWPSEVGNEELVEARWEETVEDYILDAARHDPCVTSYFVQTFGLTMKVGDEKDPDAACLEVRQVWVDRIAQFQEKAMVEPGVLGDWEDADGTMVNDGVDKGGLVQSYRTSEYNQDEPV